MKEVEVVVVSVEEEVVEEEVVVVVDIGADFVVVDAAAVVEDAVVVVIIHITKYCYFCTGMYVCMFLSCPIKNKVRFSFFCEFNN
jgi:hypothetical protein